MIQKFSIFYEKFLLHLHCLHRAYNRVCDLKDSINNF